MISIRAAFATLLMVFTLAGGVQPALAELSPGEGYYETPNYHDCGDCSVDQSGERPALRVLRTEGARYEHVVIGPQGQADAVRQAIEDAGGAIIRTRNMDALGQTTQIATFASRAALEAAQTLIAQLAPDSSLALHHLYYFAQSRRSPRVYAPALIGDPAPERCRLMQPISIGMIDGPVNIHHPALQGVDLTYETIIDGHREPSADHGTAVAALLVGEDGTGALAGFARGARLYAISVFSDRENIEEASVEGIAEAIDKMVAHGVRLINLSIAGPENAALGRALHAAAGQGVVMIAASGNDQRPLVSWPAASPDVIAVTAVDAARRRFRRANTGVQIEFAAPGVDVYTARANGAGYATGTSFAAPIVTALAARQMAHGVRSLDGVRAQLRSGVETLGPGTRNTDFGWGLVRAHGC